jgi:murein DD-endopeptidase MepM/ murein hydrolase activator NlpD
VWRKWTPGFPGAKDFILFFSLWVSVQPAMAQRCPGEQPRFHAVDEPEGIVFYVEAPAGPSISIHLDVTFEGLSPDRPLPFQTTVPAGTQRRILVLAKTGRPFRYRYTYRWAPGVVDARHDPGIEYELPWATGSTFTLMQGPNGAFSHSAMYAYDFGMPENTPVHAARAGIVVAVCAPHRAGGPDRLLEDKANYIEIEHLDGTFGGYFHLRHNGAVTRPGQRVAAGELIGYSGNTGFSTAPHLHFEVFRLRRDLTRESLPVRFRQARRPAEGTAYTAVRP